LKDNGLKDKIEKAIVSQRLTKSPAALVASSYGWSGNMERIMKSQAYAKSKATTQDYSSSQKKTLEINPRHPVIKELLKRVVDNKEYKLAVNTALLLWESSTLRSGFALRDTSGFADRIDVMLKSSLNLHPDDMPEEEPEEVLDAEEASPKDDIKDEDDEEDDSPKKKHTVEEEHVEL